MESDRKRTLVATQFATQEMSDVELNELLNGYWYYSFEVQPGVFSNGNAHKNTLLTRELLRRIDVTGTKCLDIGTMEGLIPTVLKRRGAAHVTASDRSNLSKKINLVKKSFDVDWDYRPGTKIQDLGTTLQNQLPFDVLVFSGVLYHMFDPMGGLIQLRSLVHPGALVVVETLAIIEDSMGLYFNDKQHFYPHSTYFAPAIPCLQGLLQTVGLYPIDCVWFDQPRKTPTNQRFCRIGVTCRATDIPVVEDPSFKEFANVELLKSFNGENVPCTPGDCIKLESGTEAPGEIDLLATVLRKPEFEIDLEKLPLRQSDEY